MSLFETPAGTDPVAALVGEDKKFKTVEDLARAKIESDNFIEQLKREQAELRAELTARPAVDRSQEILDRLEALRKEPVTEQPANQQLERTEVNGLSINDVERVLEERERKARAQANINSVKAKLQETYGDKYGQALKLIAEKNGLTAQSLDQLAAQSPQLVLNLMGQVKVDTGFTPPSSSTTLGKEFAPTAGGARTKSYYNKLKAEDRTKYFSREVQTQMYKDAMALAEAFEDV